MAQAGISTLGVLFGYGVETTAGEKPAAFTQLTRINSIGGITITQETIDASTLEDLVERTIAGRGTTGGTFDVTVNMTNDTVAEWTALIAAADTAEKDGKGTWFEVYSPYLTQAFYIVAQPPKVIPMPTFDQNGLQTVAMTLTIGEYKGLDTAIKPTTV